MITQWNIIQLQKEGNTTVTITQIDLEGIVLSEISYAKSQIVLFHLCDIPRIINGGRNRVTGKRSRTVRD